MDPAGSSRAVHFAIDQGINFFEVSPYYGLTLAEERLGQALDGRRKEVILATKCGRYGADVFNFSGAHIREGLDGSLKRLRTDHVDLLQVHDVEFGDVNQIIHETIPTMRRLQEKGKARYIGITGYPLNAIVVCLYGCLRAVQATTSRAAIGWLCFAVAAGAICGTTRQIAWLGVLVMGPSTVWLLRSRRSVLLAGIAATIAGDLFILACMQWFKHQPYNVPEHLLVNTFSLSRMFSQMGRTFLDAPFLLLPIVALFLPGIRKSRPRVLVVVALLFAGYLFMATFQSHLRGSFPLDPVGGDWVGIHGVSEVMMLKGQPPILLSRGVQALLTVVSIRGVFGLICSIRSRRLLRPADPLAVVSWNQFGWMLGPMVAVYLLLLIPRARAFRLIDRYLLPLLVVAMLCMVRFYQDDVMARLPPITEFLIGVLAIYGIVNTHNTFAVDRGRVALAEELRAAGVPDTAVDGGWEYNQEIELQHSRFINDCRMVLPKNAYAPAPPLAAGTCEVNGYDLTPHIQPLYGISFDTTMRHLAAMEPEAAQPLISNVK